MTNHAPSPDITVSTSGRVVDLFTNKWFQRFRHTLPLLLLVSIGIQFGFPALGNEYLMLVPLLVGLCTFLTRYGARKIAASLDDGKQSKVLLKLNESELYLGLDSTEFRINLNECHHIRVYRVLWWLSPYIVFAIERHDGYERRVLTHIDLPELYTALKRISNDIVPPHSCSPL